MLATIIISIVLLVVIALIIRSLVKKRKLGQSCCSGSVGGCLGCGSDSSCPSCTPTDMHTATSTVPPTSTSAVALEDVTADDKVV
ncbi:MAG: FeoB-associated Cys-rich membrane protein [Coriobacteriales bacterium]|jgi:hypothetical protein|nr:FeoB-associated Cys-rich membrane protein [Coriobacteriales bacterium]